MRFRPPRRHRTKMMWLAVATVLAAFATAESCEKQVDNAVEDIETELARAQPPFALPTTGFLGACWGDPGVASEFGDPHTGIDVWDAKDQGFGPDGLGEIVYAVYAGEVTQSEGPKIQIAQDQLPDLYSGAVPQLGVVTYYTHLSERLVGVTERVEKGQPIGRQGVGNGIVHLHFSIKKGSGDERTIANTLDPGAYLGLDLHYPNCGVGTPRWLEPFGD